MAKSVLDIVGFVYRKLEGQYPTDRLYEAFLRAHREIYQNYLWPWTQTTANLQVNALYQTGTVSITDGTAALTGNGTLFNTGWKHKQISMGTNVDYPIASFTSSTVATLAQTVNLGYDVADAAFTIYQVLYPLPSDCEPGGIVCIVNPTIRYRLRNTSLFNIEGNILARGTYFNNLQSAWCDAGYDDTDKVYLVRVDPPPSTTTEYRIVYNKNTSDPSTLTATTSIPPTFDQILELLTEAQVKRPANDPTWKEANQLAYQTIHRLRQRIATQIDDSYSGYNLWSVPGANSIVDPSGLVITGPVSAP